MFKETSLGFLLVLSGVGHLFFVYDPFVWYVLVGILVESRNVLSST